MTVIKPIFRLGNKYQAKTWYQGILVDKSTNPWAQNPRVFLFTTLYCGTNLFLLVERLNTWHNLIIVPIMGKYIR